MNEAEYPRMFEVEDRHWWYLALRERIERDVRREFARRGPLRLFDAGCGTGGLLARLGGYGEASGCDAAPQAVALCRRRGLAGVVQADLNGLALEPARYDVITAIDVLYHGWIRDEDDVLRRLAAALRPGGALIVHYAAFDCLRGPHDEAVHIRRRERAPALRARLQAAGLAVETLTYRLGFLFLPILLARWARRCARPAGAPPRSDVDLPPPLLNAALLALCRAENRLAARAALPFGSSLYALARRP